MYRKIASATLTSLCLALSACGGGGDGGSAPPPSSSPPPPAPSPAPRRTASGTQPAAGRHHASHAPANVTAVAQSATSILVSWGASTDDSGISGYRVFRNGGADGHRDGADHVVHRHESHGEHRLQLHRGRGRQRADAQCVQRFNRGQRAHAGASRHPARCSSPCSACIRGPHAHGGALAAARAGRYQPLDRRAAGRPRARLRRPGRREHHQQRARHHRSRGIPQRARPARPRIPSELPDRQARLGGIHARDQPGCHRDARLGIRDRRRRRDAESRLRADRVRNGAAGRAQQRRPPAVRSRRLPVSRHGRRRQRRQQFRAGRQRPADQQPAGQDPAHRRERHDAARVATGSRPTTRLPPTRSATSTAPARRTARRSSPGDSAIPGAGPSIASAASCGWATWDRTRARKWTWS